MAGKALALLAKGGTSQQSIDLDNEGDRDLLIKKRRSKMDYAEFENGEFKDEVEFLIRK